MQQRGQDSNLRPLGYERTEYCYNIFQKNQLLDKKNITTIKFSYIYASLKQKCCTIVVLFLQWDILNHLSENQRKNAMENYPLN